MGLLSTNLLAASADPGLPLISTMTLTLPDATTRRYAMGDVSSLSLGHHHGLIKSISPVRRTTGDRDNALQGVSATVRLIDVTGEFAALQETVEMHRITVTLAVTSSRIGAADGMTFFNGVLDAVDPGWPESTIRLRMDDEPLTVPVSAGKTNKIDFPNCHPDHLDKDFPIIYGTHDATVTGGTSKGACQALYTDTANRRFMCSIGALKTVPRVYKDGVLQTITTHYTLGYTVIAGTLFTVLSWTSDPGTSAITFDCTGYDSIGNTTGTLLTNPATVFRHLLSNFVYAKWKQGSWLAEHSILSTPHWDTLATNATGLGQPTIALRVADGPTGLSLLNSFCKQCEFLPYWTNTGKIAVGIYEHRVTSYPTNTLRYDVDMVGTGHLEYQTETKAVVGASSSPYGWNSVLNKSLATTVMSDSVIPSNIVQDVPRPWFLTALETRVPMARRMNRWRRLRPRLMWPAKFSAIDHDLLTDVGVVHPSGPQADRLGWGNKDYERRLHRVLSTEFDPARNVVTLGLDDLRGTQASFNWSGNPEGAPVTGSNTREGTFDLFGGGVTLTSTRSTVKYVDDPTSSVIQKLAVDQIPLDTRGTLMEAASKNEFADSPFFGGIGGWTATNGSGTAAIDTGERAFDDSLYSGGGALKMTAGNPHSVETWWLAPQTVATITNGTKCRLSLDYRMGDAAQTPPTWRMIQVADGQYWNDSTGAWQVGAVNNSLPATVSRSRFISKLITMTATSKLWFACSQMPGGTVSRVAWLHHAQVEQYPWATSRIACSTAATTRGHDLLSFTNDWNQSQFAINRLRGTFSATVTPQWDSADVASSPTAFLILLAAFYDANNAFQIYYHATNAEWVFTITSGGTSYTTTKAYTGTRGVPVKVTARWTSASGELGLAANTASIFVNDVKGSDVTYVSPVFAAASSVFLGCQTSSTQVAGYVSKVRCVPWVLSDNEIKRFP